MLVWPCSYLKDTVLHVITSIRLDLFMEEITLHANINLMHQRKALTVEYTFLGTFAALYLSSRTV